MLGLNMEELAKSIAHPFVGMLDNFDKQMAKLHEEVAYTNSLLEGIKNALENQGKDQEDTSTTELPD